MKVKDMMLKMRKIHPNRIFDTDYQFNFEENTDNFEKIGTKKTKFKDIDKRPAKKRGTKTNQKMKWDTEK